MKERAVRTVVVPDDYVTIQEAINHASVGDIVFVKHGTYYENAIVNETILLIGENRENTIVDARGIGKALELKKNAREKIDKDARALSSSTDDSLDP